MTQPTVPADLVRQINETVEALCCDVPVVQMPDRVELAPCGKPATHTLIVHCPTHGPRLRYVLCPDHTRRISEAARHGYAYRCGGACRVTVETQVL